MSVSLHDVRHALTELGRLRFGEMRVEEAMHQIVETTHAIFSVDGAGLMLADADHHLRNAAVSDDRMRHLEELQLRLQEGPCIALAIRQQIQPFSNGGRLRRLRRFNTNRLRHSAHIRFLSMTWSRLFGIMSLHRIAADDVSNQIITARQAIKQQARRGGS